MSNTGGKIPYLFGVFIFEFESLLLNREGDQRVQLFLSRIFTRRPQCGFHFSFADCLQSSNYLMKILLIILISFDINLKATKEFP